VSDTFRVWDGPEGLLTQRLVSNSYSEIPEIRSMDKTKRIYSRKKEEHRMRTHQIHGNYESRRWDYDHLLIPPISSFATLS
jgi:hypothetical protein